MPVFFLHHVQRVKLVNAVAPRLERIRGNLKTTLADVRERIRPCDRKTVDKSILYRPMASAVLATNYRKNVGLNAADDSHERLIHMQRPAAVRFFRLSVDVDRIA